MKQEILLKEDFRNLKKIKVKIVNKRLKVKINYDI